MKNKLKISGVPNSYFYSNTSCDFGYISNFVTKAVEWESCREGMDDNFQDGFIRRYLFIFINDVNRLKNIINTIKFIEKTIKVPIKYRSKFVETNYNKVIAVQMSRFWKTKIKFSLFTLLIRLGGIAKNHTNVLSLRHEYLTPNVRYAVRRFLNRNTKIIYRIPTYDASFVGFVDYFQSLTYREIDKVLVK